MFRLNRVKAENEALKKKLSDLKNKYQTDIPKVPLSSTPEEMLYGIKYSNDIAVYVTMLEYVAKFLFDVIGSYFNRN